MGDARLRPVFVAVALHATFTGFVAFGYMLIFWVPRKRFSQNIGRMQCAPTLSVPSAQFYSSDEPLYKRASALALASCPCAAFI
jgi:hypothetical protein